MTQFKYPPIQKTGPADRETEDKLIACERLRESNELHDLCTRYIIGTASRTDFLCEIDDLIDRELETIADQRKQDAETAKFGGRYA
jgi:hypothetical protein